jgi:hypothetical protein
LLNPTSKAPPITGEFCASSVAGVVTPLYVICARSGVVLVPLLPSGGLGVPPPPLGGSVLGGGVLPT